MLGDVWVTVQGATGEGGIKAKGTGEVGKTKTKYHSKNVKVGVRRRNVGCSETII